jgi:hypothetical protein
MKIPQPVSLFWLRRSIYSGIALARGFDRYKLKHCIHGAFLYLYNNS